MLDWTMRPEFLAELEALLSPFSVKVPSDAQYMPRGYENPREARLERFLLQTLTDASVSAQLQEWWLVHTGGANTPNWDIAVTCEIEGRAGLVLVEAKANWPELGRGGKRLARAASLKSIENHKRISDAVSEACRGWRRIDSRVAISSETHYQLSNRLAFAWKLATLGVPVVLVYLGFTGDEGIRDAGAPFLDDADWRTAFAEYSEGVVPIELFGSRHDFGPAPVWLGLLSRDVLESSSKRN